MSLILNMGTMPRGLSAVVPFVAQEVWLGFQQELPAYEVPIAKFLAVVEDVLVSDLPVKNDLGLPDPRLRFLTYAQALELERGYNIERDPTSQCFFSRKAFLIGENFSGQRVFLNKYEVFRGQGSFDLSIEDFLLLTRYVLTNTDVIPDDPRIAFVDKLKSAKVVEQDGVQERIVF